MVIIMMTIIRMMQIVTVSMIGDGNGDHCHATKASEAPLPASLPE
jgi:hypothetical protein